MSAPQRPRTPPIHASKAFCPPTPRPTPPKSRHRPVPIPRHSEQPSKNPARVFIADHSGRNTVVFDTRGDLSEANRQWLKYGRLDPNGCASDDETVRSIRAMSMDETATVVGKLHEVIDLTALEDLPDESSSHRGMPPKRRREEVAEQGRGGDTKRRRGEDVGWSVAQQKALWNAQVSRTGWLRETDRSILVFLPVF